MTEKIIRLTSELAQAKATDSKRDTARRLQEEALKRRTTLAKRGEFDEPAKSPLGDTSLDALHSAIEDPDQEVRRLAVKSTGDLGGSRSVEALIGRLSDDDPRVRLAAVISLGEIGGQHSVRALAQVVRSDAVLELRLAALTELEELAAKSITSGPDRHFDPSEAADEPDDDQAPGLSPTKDAVIESLARVERKDDEAVMRLKARDVRRYLEDGPHD